MSYTRNSLLSLINYRETLNTVRPPSHAPATLPLTNNVWGLLYVLQLLAPTRGLCGGKNRRLPSTLMAIRPVYNHQPRYCPKPSRSSNRNNLLIIQTTSNSNSLLPSQRHEFLSNVMSLAPKIDEIRVSVAQHKPDLVFLTETWLKESIGDPVISLPNYNLTRRDRTQGIHGGVCLFSNSSIVTERLL